jgi:hypothetical protein
MCFPSFPLVVMTQFVFPQVTTKLVSSQMPNFGHVENIKYIRYLIEQFFNVIIYFLKNPFE